MNPCILVADDAMFMRKVINSALTEAGYCDVIMAQDGEEAVQKYLEYHPQLVLLDITMPVKSGIDVLGEILQADSSAKIIICSAIGQEEIITEAIRMGAVDFIVKPFKKDQLIQLIESVIR